LLQAYYAAISHVDDCIGLLLSEIEQLQLSDATAVVLTADHGQNLGEFDMWSMMNLMDTSLRVPLIIRPAHRSLTSKIGSSNVYPHPVELVDLYPTLIRLAGFSLADGTLHIDAVVYGLSRCVIGWGIATVANV